METGIIYFYFFSVYYMRNTILFWSLHFVFFFLNSKLHAIRYLALCYILYTNPFPSFCLLNSGSWLLFYLRDTIHEMRDTNKTSDSGLLFPSRYTTYYILIYLLSSTFFFFNYTLYAKCYTLYAIFLYPLR